MRLIVEAGASSSRAYIGLGSDEAKSLSLRQFGLGLGELGSDLSVSGLNLRFRISRIYSEKVSGSLAFATRIFSLAGFRRGFQTNRCLQTAITNKISPNISYLSRNS